MCALWLAVGNKERQIQKKDKDSADREEEGISESAFTSSSMQGMWIFEIGAFGSKFP